MGGPAECQPCDMRGSGPCGEASAALAQRGAAAAPLLLQMEHISGLIKLSKVRAALGGTPVSGAQLQHSCWCCVWGCPALLCPTVSRAALGAFPNICALHFQADVERKLSQMILDKKFHGETPHRCPGSPPAPLHPSGCPRCGVTMRRRCPSVNPGH